MEKDDKRLPDISRVSSAFELSTDKEVNRFSEQFKNFRPMIPGGRDVSLLRLQFRLSREPGLESVKEVMLFAMQSSAFNAVEPVADIAVIPPFPQATFFKAGRLFKLSGVLNCVQVRNSRLFKLLSNNCPKLPSEQSNVFRAGKLLMTKGGNDENGSTL